MIINLIFSLRKKRIKAFIELEGALNFTVLEKRTKIKQQNPK